MRNVRNAILIAIAALLLLTGCQMLKNSNAPSKGNAMEEKKDENKVDDLVKRDAKMFPKFSAKDFSGNDVDESIFKNNKLTIVNMWFTGCKPCVEEMPYLGELYKKNKDRGVNLIGICADAGSEEYLKTAKDIMKNANADFTQLVVKDDESNKDMMKFMEGVQAFPSTYIVDENGNIIAGPILGALNEKSNEKEISPIIDEHLKTK
ncbi:MAG: TlpA disulfide reductase family protein [Ezakiella sp.]|nr:TlpA disulfide reductase family protein [Ezakiella sp.]